VRRASANVTYDRTTQAMGNDVAGLYDDVLARKYKRMA